MSNHRTEITPATPRYLAWRKVERLLGWLIRGCPPVKGYTHKGEPRYRYRPSARCDSIIIGSGPWICYCCKSLRFAIAGVKWGEVPEKWVLGAPLALRFKTIYTNRGAYVWPCKKYIYPQPGSMPA